MDQEAPPARKLRVTLEYDGSGFCGWQRQDGPRSVQQVVEEALDRVVGHECITIAAGRTDTGVHALGQTISFATQSTLPPQALVVLLNRELPPDVAVLSVHEAPARFDARRDAQCRHYRFHLLRRIRRTAIAPHMVTLIPTDVRVDAMKEAAEILVGDHDFRAFRSTACQARRTRLDLQSIRITSNDHGVLLVDVSCRSFLHNMVRILTGTLINHSRGRISLDEIRAMLATGERHHEAVTIAPNGLFLRQVDYPEEILTMPGAHVSFPLDHPSPAGGPVASCATI